LFGCNKVAETSAEKNLFLHKIFPDEILDTQEAIKTEKFSDNEKELEKLKTRKQRFTDTLKREYLKISEKLTAKNNYTDATYFRRKAYNSDTYLDVLPERPEEWNIKSDSSLNTLRLARNSLMNSINFNVITVAPKAAAQGIATYDCWVEQEKNKWNKDDVNCKNSFRDIQKYLAQIHVETSGKSIEQLKKEYSFIDTEEDYLDYRAKPAQEKYQGAYKGNTPVVSQLDKPLDEVNPKINPAATKPKSMRKTSGVKDFGKSQKIETAPSLQNAGFIVADSSNDSDDLVYLAYFDEDKFDINEKAKVEIEKSLAEIAKAKPQNIILNGHTDKSFDTNTSLSLSKKRADAVRDYLGSKGVDKNIIKTYGFGKTDNLVENKEGEKAPANNRVEIIFKTSKPAEAKPETKTTDTKPSTDAKPAESKPTETKPATVKSEEKKPS
jgi:outer membrane protein OmpA-like peptidoglycan-associated protein